MKKYSLFVLLSALIFSTHPIDATIADLGILEDESKTVVSAQPPALVIASPKTLGLGVVRELLGAGRDVVMYTDKSTQARQILLGEKNLTIIQGVPENYRKLLEVMKDKKEIYYCPHFERYPMWKNRLMHQVRSLLGAVKKDQTICFPSIFYVLGKKTGVYAETTPVKPCCQIGTAYFTAEQCFIAAAEAGKCKTVILRHSLGYGPGFYDGLTNKIFKNALLGKKMEWVCDLKKPFQLCYAPDITRCMRMLTEKMNMPIRSLKPKNVMLVNFGGATVNSVKSWMEAIANQAGTKARTRAISRFLISIGSFFHADAKTAQDLLYSFEKNIFLDDSKLKKILPNFSYTPLNIAIFKTLKWFAQPEFVQ